MASPKESLHKAAVFLSSLPSEQRTQLLARIEPSQAAAVTLEMNRLGTLAGAEQEAIVRELVELRPKPAPPFQFLHGRDCQCLLELLDGEHPQTLALVLSHLPSQQAGEVLAELPAAQQLAIVCRIATMSEPSRDVIVDVESVMRRNLSNTSAPSAGNPSFTGVVRMLNHMTPSAERTVLAKLAAADPQLTRELRLAMFGADVVDCESQEITGVAC